MKFVIELNEGEEFTNFDLAKEICRVCSFEGNKLSAFAIAQMILIQEQEKVEENCNCMYKCEE